MFLLLTLHKQSHTPHCMAKAICHARAMNAKHTMVWERLAPLPQLHHPRALRGFGVLTLAALGGLSRI